MRLVRIKKIAPIISTSKRYDIEVADNHNFFANNILVHNSLGICFHWKGKWHITTRGSLNSDIGEIAQKMLDEFGGIPEGVCKDDTILFEIIF